MKTSLICIFLDGDVGPDDIEAAGEGDGDDALGNDLAVLPDGRDEDGHAQGVGRLVGR